MGLGDVVREDRGESSVDDSLVEWMQANIGERRVVNPIGPDDNIRSSGLYKLCAREQILAAQNGVQLVDEVTPDLKFIFNIGHGLHHTMQDHILGEGGLIIGAWVCLSCGLRHGSYAKGGDGSRIGMIRRPESCERCQRFSLVYSEISLKDKELKISGHIDGIHPNVTDIWEFKSINSFYLQKLRRSNDAKPDHRIQAFCYMHLCRVNGIGIERARIVYIDKSAPNLKSAFYEVVVPWTDGEAESSLRQAKELRRAQADGDVPDRICGSETCARAKDCAVASICFASSGV